VSTSIKLRARFNYLTLTTVAMQVTAIFERWILSGGGRGRDGSRSRA